MVHRKVKAWARLASRCIIFIPNFVKFSSVIQNLKGHTQTDMYAHILAYFLGAG
jgi:hypothetical protein